MQIADDLDVITSTVTSMHNALNSRLLQTFRVRALKYTHILGEFSSPDEKPKSEESKVTGTEAFVFTGCTY